MSFPCGMGCELFKGVVSFFSRSFAGYIVSSFFLLMRTGGGGAVVSGVVGGCPSFVAGLFRWPRFLGFVFCRFGGDGVARLRGDQGQRVPGRCLVLGAVPYFSFCRALCFLSTCPTRRWGKRCRSGRVARLSLEEGPILCFIQLIPGFSRCGRRVCGCHPEWPVERSTLSRDPVVRHCCWARRRYGCIVLRRRRYLDHYGRVSPWRRHEQGAGRSIFSRSG